MTSSVLNAPQRREAILLLDPFHPVGLAVCRKLARQGLRPVAVSRSPAAGRSFSCQLASHGISVHHRTVDVDFRHCEDHLAEDISDVYGGLAALLSFFSPALRQERWLDLPPLASNELLKRALARRMRLLRALGPLLTGQGFIQNIVLGAPPGAGVPSVRLDRAAAHLWDDLLRGEWQRRGVPVWDTVAREDDGSEDRRIARAADRVLEDFTRCRREMAMARAAS